MRKTGSTGSTRRTNRARGTPTSEATARGLSTARLLGSISANTISTNSDAAANRPAWAAIPCRSMASPVIETMVK